MGIEALGQQSQATTPTFSGAPIPGLPGQPQPQTGVDPNQKAQQILATLLQAAQRKQAANTAVPMNIPPQQDPNAAREIGMGTANPRGWGLQRFSAGIATNIKNAVAKQKQDQLLKAEGDWTYLQSALNEKFAAEQSGDQQGAQAAEAKLQAILGDPKKLKNMAKALNQDWLNPEKTTVYGEALKKVAGNQKQQDQQNAQKQTAAQKLKSAVMGLLKKKQELQLSLDEQKRMAQEIEKKAPTTTPGIDKESALTLREQLRDEARRKEEADKEAARATELDKKEAARQKELDQKEKFQKEEVEMKEKIQRQRDSINNTFHEHMETMRERSAEQRQSNHDLMMMKALGMKLDEEDQKLFKADKSKMNKEVTDTVTSLRQQLAQSQTALRSLKTSASNHWLMGPGKDEITEAESQVDSLQRAIGHIEKNRDAVVDGKMNLDDVVKKAYDILGGGGDDVPGFKPDQPVKAK